MKAAVDGGGDGSGAPVCSSKTKLTVQKQVISEETLSANAASAEQNPGGATIMPLLLLLLFSFVESNNNNNNKEEKEETVTEYSSAFINVSWVEPDRQVRGRSPPQRKCFRFFTRK